MKNWSNAGRDHLCLDVHKSTNGWEVDTIIDKDRREAIVAPVERKSRLTLLEKEKLMSELPLS